MSEPSPLSLIIDRLDRLDAELGDTTEKGNEIPVLRKEVAMLSKEVERLSGVVFQAALAILVTGVLGLVTALILKGVIG